MNLTCIITTFAKNENVMAKDAFPSSTLFHYPILLLLADDKVHTRREIVAHEIKMLSISEPNQKLLTPKGVNKVVSWTSYAISDLKKAEYIEYSGRGYVITQDGKAFFERYKDGFVAKDLKASRAYREYKKFGEYGKYIPKKSKYNKNKSNIQDISIIPSIKKEINNDTEDGVVYILTNPAFKTFYIKIGYTTNIDDRLKELYNTSVPLPFKVYAILKTKKYKQAEKMIHSAFKASRIGNDREFFMLKPEEALEQMKVVAEGLEAVITMYDDNGNEKKTLDYTK